MEIVIKVDPTLVKFHPQSGKLYFTYDAIAKNPEWPDGPLLEIIHGELYMVPSPTVEHQRIALKLATLLKYYVDSHNSGEIFTAPIDVLFSPENTTVPDIIFISSDKSTIINPKNIQGTPDLIIEILLSNKNRDRVEKLKLYQEFGVKEYWVVDPQEQTITTYLYYEASQKFSTEKTYNRSNRISVTVLPGCSFELKQIFGDIN